MATYNELVEVNEDCPSRDKATYTREEIEEYVEITRLHLYNLGLPCGPKAIRKYLEEVDEVSQPLPSERTIGRILAKRCLTHGRTGYYEGDYR
jgi:hypothetical protein